MNNRNLLLNENILRAASMMQDGFLMETKSEDDSELDEFEMTRGVRRELRKRRRQEKREKERMARREAIASAKRAKSNSYQQSSEENPDNKKLQRKAKNTDKSADKAEEKLEKTTEKIESGKFIGWAKTNPEDALLIWECWVNSKLGEQAKSAFGDTFIPDLTQCGGFPQAYSYATNLKLKYFMFENKEYQVKDSPVDNAQNSQNSENQESIRARYSAGAGTAAVAAASSDSAGTNAKGSEANGQGEANAQGNSASQQNQGNDTQQAEKTKDENDSEYNNKWGLQSDTWGTGVSDQFIKGNDDESGKALSTVGNGRGADTVFGNDLNSATPITKQKTNEQRKRAYVNRLIKEAIQDELRRRRR